MRPSMITRTLSLVPNVHTYSTGNFAYVCVQSKSLKCGNQYSVIMIGYSEYIHGRSSGPGPSGFGRTSFQVHKAISKFQSFIEKPTVSTDMYTCIKSGDTRELQQYRVTLIKGLKINKYETIEVTNAG